MTAEHGNLAEQLVRPAPALAIANERAPSPSPLVRRMSLGQEVFADNGAVELVAHLQRLIDPLLVLLTLVAAVRLYGLPFDGAHVALGLIAALLTHILFTLVANTKSWHEGGALGLAAHVFGSWMMLSGVLLLLGVATHTVEYYVTPAVFVWLVAAPVLLFGHHLLARTLLGSYLRSGAHTRRAVIAGVNATGRQLARELERQPQLGLSFQGFFDDRSPTRLHLAQATPLRGRLDELAAYVGRENIDVIYIALPMVQQARILSLLADLRDTTASIYFVPDVFVFDLIQGRIAHVNGLPVLAVCETPFIGHKALIKRATDLVLASAILVLIAPLLAAIALGVKLSSPGPVLFKQRRYGMDGREIAVYKFRSMRVCEDGAHIPQARRDDPRVTRFGAFLRRTSLDELPQFFNVLQGRMSVVGPRPHAVAHNELYRKLIAGYMVRHKVRPGITGWAQVNGLRGETERIEKMRQRIEYDLEYLRRWSPGLDLRIVLQTFWVLFRDRHAY
jgi:putative colanic acid biosynthesis UDP-glucose lipid carrier transferase